MMSIAAIYECPSCAAPDTGGPAAVALRLRQPSEPGAGAGAGPRRDRRRTKPRCGATAPRWRLRDPPRVSLGEGWTPLVDAALGRRAGAVQARIADADRLVQGSRHRGHAEPSDRGRGRRRSTRTPRAMPAPRSRPTRPRPGFAAASTCPATAPRGKIVQIAASGAEVRAIPGTRQDVTEAALAAIGRELLRQPQLAAVLYRGHQDAGLRTVGAARLPRAGQHPRADRLWQQHPRPRPRLRRTRTQRRDRRAARASSPCRPRIAPPSRPPGRPAPTITSPFAPAPTAADGIATVKPVRTRRGAERAAPLRRRRRRGAGSRDRPGAAGARPSRPVRRADRRDRRRRRLAAAATAARSARTKPRSSS